MIKSLFHFLGGVSFAILLIASVTVLVILGTIVESKTDSHRFAAQLTYGNPVFTALLWGFFINILFAALRRWPFKWRHIPFLITHWGLLMILSGALAKSYWGTQGTMTILEGSGSQEIFLPDTYVVHVEKNDAAHTRYYFPVKRSWNGKFQTLIADGDLKIEMLEYFPHAHEQWNTWIKEGKAYVSGLKPFAVHANSHPPFPISSRLKMTDNDAWELLALRTDDVVATARQAYLDGLSVTVADPLTQKVMFEGPLEEALGEHITLDFAFSPVLGLAEPHLAIESSGRRWTIPLHTLQDHSGPLLIDLMRTPRLVWIQDPQGDVYLFAFDPWGRIFADTFRRDNLNTLVVYDQGYGGYAVQAKIPYRKEGPRAIDHLRVEQLSQELLAATPLPPPLQSFKQACNEAHVNFESCLKEYLARWNQNGGWLWDPRIVISDSLERALAGLRLTSTEQKACQWACALFKDLDGNLYENLKSRGWPMLEALEPYKNDPVLLSTVLTRQVLAAGEHLPAPPFIPEPQARLFSVLLRAYGIHVSSIDTLPSPIEYVTLEAPLTTQHIKEKPISKMEDLTPTITLKVSEGARSDYVTLLYDRFGNGLKWPILGGSYSLRFQPAFQEIPYRLRLRQARQINYPNTQQPYSYESDIIVRDLTHGTSIEKTLSMNNVHETWDGYRFYMASLFPPAETAAKRVQIAVNHDPAKYFLTYPGALILTAGIALLFWAKKRNK